MYYQFGFIGTGNMGGALAKAVSKAVPYEQIYLADHDQQKMEDLAKLMKCNTASSREVAAKCHYIFLGVKPQVLPVALAEIAPVLAARQDSFVLVSMAAGVPIADVQRLAGGDYPVIRIMPNTPVAVGSGVVMYAPSPQVSKDALHAFCHAMDFAGYLDQVAEHLIDAGSAVSGCGPAFACMFMEALADGGVACGLPRDKALLYAAYMLEGTARLAVQSGQHPGALKDAVCSPGGSTIAGVQALEEGAMRAAVMNAVKAAYIRTKELGK